jgi:hypothetical protein
MLRLREAATLVLNYYPLIDTVKANKLINIFLSRSGVRIQENDAALTPAPVTVSHLEN